MKTEKFIKTVKSRCGSAADGVEKAALVLLGVAIAVSLRGASLIEILLFIFNAAIWLVVILFITGLVRRLMRFLLTPTHRPDFATEFAIGYAPAVHDRLSRLRRRSPGALNQLVALANDSNHRLPQWIIDDLSLSLLVNPNGTINRSVARIVIAAVDSTQEPLNLLPLPETIARLHKTTAA